MSLNMRKLSALRFKFLAEEKQIQLPQMEEV